MMKTDTLHPVFLDILVALCLLTRLPLPQLPDTAFERSAKAVWAYPVAGAVLGGLAAIVGLVALSLGLPAVIAGGLSLCTLALLTGAMHEDGLSDTADGFWGGQTVERRLEIMKDSQIGSFGTMALVLVTGLRWASYAVLLPVSAGAIVFAAVVSRAIIPVLMASLPHARQKGLSRSVGTPGATSVAIGLTFAIAFGLVITGLTAIPIALGALTAAAAVGWVAKRKIGGQTGDVLGASQQVAEVVVLIILAAMLA